MIAKNESMVITSNYNNMGNARKSNVIHNSKLSDGQYFFCSISVTI